MDNIPLEKKRGGGAQQLNNSLFSARNPYFDNYKCPKMPDRIFRAEGVNG
jgi:hypothetical protein